MTLPASIALLTYSAVCWPRPRVRKLLTLTAWCLVSQCSLAQTSMSAAESSGPVRLRQPVSSAATTSPSTTLTAGTSLRPESSARLPLIAERTGDFERYVRGLQQGADVTRFATELMLDSHEANDFNPLVPPDYLLRPGDELVVTLWGSIDADLRLQVDRSGRISIPRVGPIMVSGVRYADLPDTISRRVSQVFKNFQLSVSLGQLRGIHVYVTGFATKPGAVQVGSLSTLVQALAQAGGPSAAGSYRDIQLRRGGKTIATYDLYDLLLKGERSADLRLEADDVIHVAPVGRQVAVLGSVNRPAILELKAGEKVADALRMCGGLSAVANPSSLTLERFAERDAGHVTQLSLPADQSAALNTGDVLRALNATDIALPTERQNKRVRIEGEVAKPGEYVLPPTSTLADALKAAGGPTGKAYLYAANFTRESVRRTQQENFERALRDLETQINTNAATRRTSNTEEANAVTASTAANSRLLDQLKTMKPTGRVVLQLSPTATQLPNLPLEDGDRLLLPATPTTIGVFGSVFSAGSYLYTPDRTLGDYLKLAGGPTKGADKSSLFVVHADGQVNSSLQNEGFFTRGNQLAGLKLEPGDTVFLPEEMDKTTWLQSAKDWTQIFFQIAVGFAGLKTSTGW